MMNHVKVIAFDADDTLWSNEPFFKEVEQRFITLLNTYGTPQEIADELFKTEMANLPLLGYGAKAFTISMIETALRISAQSVSSNTLGQIVALGKSLLEMPIELLDGVKETLEILHKKGCYRLVLATKGDLLDQQRKLDRSSLAPYFDHVEIMSDKTELDYTRLLKILQIHPREFLMVGNSLKSDILPVLAIGSSAVHIPFEIMWQHEVVENFAHPNLIEIPHFSALSNLHFL